MQYTGEIISLIVAVLWTATAIFAAEATKRLGTLPTNVLRMLLSIVFFGIMLTAFTGRAFPLHTDAKVWLWLSLSGLVGYVFGDWCLFNSYLYIGSRYGQLFMTLAPPTAAVLGWMFLGESLGWKSLLAMTVTLSGIAMSILSKGHDGKMHSSLPLRGILLGIGAGVGQGSGLVISKIGLEHYESIIPPEFAQSAFLLPFSSTMIRAIAGLAGFLALLLASGQWKNLMAAIRNRAGLSYTGLTTLFGPFIGVSLSLMAVQYTKAGIASTIMALTPALIILPHSLIYHEKIRFKEIAGTFVSIAGVAMFFL